MIKNLEHGKTLNLAAEIDYGKGQVVSKTICQNKALSMTLFAFDEGEGLTKHKTAGDALVTVLDGTVSIEIGDETFILNTNDSIVMPANIPHALDAVKPFKMLLTVVFES